MKYTRKRKPEARVKKDKDKDGAEEAEVLKAEDSDSVSAESAGEVDKDESSFAYGPATGVDSSYGGYYEPFEYDSGVRELEESAEFNFLAADQDYASIPHPEVFNEYPMEVQRKIMEWTDRDVKARRDDESRRQDELLRAKVAHDRMKQTIPAVIIVLAILCGAATGIATRNPLFSIAFLIIPLAVIVGGLMGDSRQSDNNGRKKSAHK